MFVTPALEWPYHQMFRVSDVIDAVAIVDEGSVSLKFNPGSPCTH